jgi:hypothetical protein
MRTVKRLFRYAPSAPHRCCPGPSVCFNATAAKKETDPGHHKCP